MVSQHSNRSSRSASSGRVARSSRSSSAANGQEQRTNAAPSRSARRRAAAQSAPAGRAVPRQSRAGKGGKAGKGIDPKTGKKKRHILRWILIAFAVLLTAGIATFAVLYATIQVPGPEKMAMAQKTTVYYADGTTPIGTFAQQNREIIECSALPDYVGNSIVASENRTFWSDKGIDLKGIGRALLNNITKGTRQGGSTITQQYAERYYLGETTTYKGKVKEAILALKIAQTQDKKQVLCNYMNTIYFGRNSYGIQAAAKAYFGVDAKDLTLLQAATLAGLIPSPNNWDPAVNKEMAQKRFTRVIKIMREDNMISTKDAKGAQMPETIANATNNVYQGTNGYLLQMVRQELVKSKAFTEEELDTGGYNIVTSIDKTQQDLMYQTASPTQAKVALPNGLQVGGIAINPKDGTITALYAGEDYITKPLNNVTQATFEVGSTMKPFTLLATVEQGVSLQTLFNGNSPRSFPGLSQTMHNAGNVSYGNINLIQATANSVNTVFMDLQQKLGSQTIADTAHKAGVTGDISTTGEQGQYTTLGNDGLTLKSMAQGYQTIANQGSTIKLHLVTHVYDSAKKDLYNPPTQSEQTFSAQSTGLVVQAMQATIQSGTGKEARSIGVPMAGKSGTANDTRAACFVGFTPSLLSYFAIWYPGEDGSAQAVPTFAGYANGGGYPAHLFTQFMKQALSGTKAEQFPKVTDDGKIGGKDGTWGLGSKQSRSYSATSENQNGQRSGESEDRQANQSSGGAGSGSGVGSGSGSGSDSRSSNTGGQDSSTSGSGSGSSGTSSGNSSGSQNTQNGNTSTGGSSGSGGSSRSQSGANTQGNQQ